MKKTAIACAAILVAATACTRIAATTDRVIARTGQAVSRLTGGGGQSFESGSNDAQFQSLGGGVGASAATVQGQQFPGQQFPGQQFPGQQFPTQPAQPQTFPATAQSTAEPPRMSGSFQQASLGTVSGGQPSATPIVPTQGQIRDVQIKLYSLNINPGPPNGILGLETANAIAFFQRRVGMRADGAISALLITQLNRAVAEAEAQGRLR